MSVQGSRKNTYRYRLYEDEWASDLYKIIYDYVLVALSEQTGSIKKQYLMEDIVGPRIGQVMNNRQPPRNFNDWVDCNSRVHSGSIRDINHDSPDQNAYLTYNLYCFGRDWITIDKQPNVTMICLNDEMEQEVEFAEQNIQHFKEKWGWHNSNKVIPNQTEIVTIENPSCKEILKTQVRKLKTSITDFFKFIFTPVIWIINWIKANFGKFVLGVLITVVSAVLVNSLLV